MTFKTILFLFISFTIGFTTSPSYGSDIISCGGFEHCPDGSVPLTNRVLELEREVARLENEVVARTPDLSGAYLYYAYLPYAKLPYANLSSANLTGVYLLGANLSDANLSDANLSDANLTGATLDNVTWSNTTCPDGSNSDTNGLNACVPLPPS
jgi:hypothetical protein